MRDQFFSFVCMPAASYRQIERCGFGTTGAGDGVSGSIPLGRHAVSPPITRPEKKGAAKRGKSHRGAQKRTRGIVRNCRVLSKACAKLINRSKTTVYDRMDSRTQLTRIVTLEREAALSGQRLSGSGPRNSVIRSAWHHRYAGLRLLLEQVTYGARLRLARGRRLQAVELPGITLGNHYPR